MRNGQNKRMRGRNRKSSNPLTRVYESNGPDVKIRGTASHVAEKYVQLARDAQSSGDPVGAENYFQHAEHYFRLIALAQEQFRQANPYYRPENEGRDDAGDEMDDDGGDIGGPGGDQPFGTGEPQPYLAREAQPYQPREQQPQGGREQRHQPNRHYNNNAQHSNAQPNGEQAGDPEQLPAFITGQEQPHQHYGNNNGGNSSNGQDGQADRFPLHRRRRRHRGPRGDRPQQSGGEGGGDDFPRSRGD
jgi:hypothetical protein